jgi:hypothetical protein
MKFGTLNLQFCKIFFAIVLSFHFWENLFLGDLLSFLFSICTNFFTKKKLFRFWRCFLPVPKCYVMEGRRGRRTWRTVRRTGIKQQNLFSQPRFGDNNTDLYVVWSPMCASVFVKRSPHWSSEESQKAFWSGDLSSFLVCERKFVWIHVFLFSYVYMCHTPIRTWTTSCTYGQFHCTWGWG